MEGIDRAQGSERGQRGKGNRERAKRKAERGSRREGAGRGATGNAKSKKAGGAGRGSRVERGGGGTGSRGRKQGREDTGGNAGLQKAPRPVFFQIQAPDANLALDTSLVHAGHGVCARQALCTHGLEPAQGWYCARMGRSLHKAGHLHARHGACTRHAWHGACTRLALCMRGTEPAQGCPCASLA